jgi:1-aminocyclopropane-1-carboxylate deaminase
MQAPDLKNITVDPWTNPFLAGSGINSFLLRLDNIHPALSGNKWFKLKFYIDDALTGKKSTILTFGGAWSNHIVATAAACKMYNLSSVGVIRGEQPAILSYTLKTALELGMKLIFVSREEYKAKLLPAGLPVAIDDIYIINEGGYGALGALGAATISGFYKTADYTHICCAVGTGTMMAGLIKSAIPGQSVIGISVLKNNADLLPGIASLLTAEEQGKSYKIIHDYHFGGYAKYNAALTSFMNAFYQKNSIATDFVYTGKLLFGICDLVRNNYFQAGNTVLVIHSGGLQGNNSLSADTLIF